MHNRGYDEAVEALAFQLHESVREAVMQGKALGNPEQLGYVQPTFVEWGYLPDDAKEGRRIQARYLLARYNMSPRF